MSFSFSIAVTSTDMQKIKKTVDTLYSEKQKMEKEKSKKGGKGKVKATIRKIGDNVSSFELSFHRKVTALIEHFSFSVRLPGKY